MAYAVQAKEEKLISVLYDSAALTVMPGGAMVLAGARSIRQGDLMTRVVSGVGASRFIVCKYTQVASASAGVDVTVRDAHPFEVGDEITIGTDNVTITAINYETNILTISAATAVAANDNVSLRANIANGRNNVVGIALLPLRDEGAAYGDGADDVTPKLGDSMYGSIALTGRFKKDQVKNFYTTTGSPILDAYDAEDRIVQNDFAAGQGIIIISTPSKRL